MDLSKINECGIAERKHLINIKELTIGGKYIICGAELTNGKFGEAILLELEEYICFLPKRVTNSFKSEIHKFIPGKYALVFQGIKPSQNFELALFEIVEV